ncbi:MAG: Rrf2 family transcriptional regulator [Salinivirgaceae bacterium]|jgi:Rrf2 family protein|nr:Rrf2 family transcriptional regulator [Salinivirgaceae bacterium]
MAISQVGFLFLNFIFVVVKIQNDNMKVSSKTIYGLQFLIRLTIDGTSNWVQLKEIVEKEHISEKYLESIVSRLKNSGLLQVKRGAHGGYKLAHPPNQITLKQIMGIIEGTGLAQDIETASAEMSTTVRQISVDAIKRVDKQFNTLLGAITLQDLANDAIQQMNSFNFMI